MPQSELAHLFYERKRLFDEVRGKQSTTPRSKEQLREPFVHQMWALRFWTDHVSVGQFERRRFQRDDKQWDGLLSEAKAKNLSNGMLSFKLRTVADWNAFQRIVKYVEEHDWSALETVTLESIVQGLSHSVEALLIEAEKRLSNEGSFDVDSDVDARERTLRLIVQRRGQKAFRDKLLAAYQRKCAISDCDCLDTLEAAHICPYMGDQTNDTTNGILLRSDLHTLFDLYRIAIDVESWTVLMHPDLRATQYAGLADKPFRLPKSEGGRPNIKALQMQRERSGL